MLQPWPAVKRTSAAAAVLLLLGLMQAAGAPFPQSGANEQSSNLNLVSVSVTGEMGAAVTGIGRERFHIFEDGVEQNIAYFLEDSRPVTVGFAIDTSAFMGLTEGGTTVLRDVVSAFLKGKRPEDEFFVLQMSDSPQMTVSFTTDAGLAPHTFPAVGDTDLYDGIYLGMEFLKEGANPRKALVVITGGGDHITIDPPPPPQVTPTPDQKRTISEETLVNTAIRQSGQVYTLFVTRDMKALADGTSPYTTPNPLAVEQISRDINVVDLLASVTGGHFSTASSSDGMLEAMCAEIARGLKTQYTIGYAPRNSAKDGKRRGLRVKVDSTPGAPKLSVWTKSGYYAPKVKPEKVN